jgi:hypothetical protein
MKKDDKDTTFRFGIVEENGKDIMIEVTEEDIGDNSRRVFLKMKCFGWFSQSAARRFS